MLDLQTAQILIAVLVVIILLLLWKMYMSSKSSFVPESIQATGQSGGAGAKLQELGQISNGPTPFSFARTNDLPTLMAYGGIPNPDYPRANVLIDSSAWADAEDELRNQVALGNDLSYGGVEDQAFRSMWSIAEGPSKVAREVQKRIGGNNPAMVQLLSDPGVAAAMANDPDVALAMQNPAVMSLVAINPGVSESIRLNPQNAVAIAAQAGNTKPVPIVSSSSALSTMPGMGMPSAMASASIDSASH